MVWTIYKDTTTKRKKKKKRERNKERGKKERKKERKRKKSVYILSTRDPHQTQGNIVTESEGMEEGIPHKWKLE